MGGDQEVTKESLSDFYGRPGPIEMEKDQRKVTAWRAGEYISHNDRLKKLLGARIIDAAFGYATGGALNHQGHALCLKEGEESEERRG